MPTALADSAGTAEGGERWCRCPDAPLFAQGAATLLEHPGECAFPAGICTVREHRVTVHETCGRELEMRFCGCGATGFIYDVERGWWIHYACGWPTKLWFEAAGTRAPEHLRGLRAVTYHEFAVVPSSPRSAYAKLDERQRGLNKGVRRPLGARPMPAEVRPDDGRAANRVAIPGGAVIDSGPAVREFARTVLSERARGA